MTQQFDPAPPQDKPKIELPVSWHEDNIRRFGADSFATTPPPRCVHVYYRYSREEIRCKRCTAGWVDHGRIPLPPDKTA